MFLKYLLNQCSYRNSEITFGILEKFRFRKHIFIFDTGISFNKIGAHDLMVLPILLERPDAPIALRKSAAQTVEGLTRRVNFSDHASRIILSLARVLNCQSHELKITVMETLSALVIQLGSDFAVFIPTIEKALRRNRVSHVKYESLITKLLNGERLPQDSSALDILSTEGAKVTEYSAPAEATKMVVNQQHLKQAWDISQVATREDWDEWMQRLSVEFMKESPSHALCACMSLVDVHTPLARELFNAAFLSCWTELYDQYQLTRIQEDLVRSIEYALTSQTAPSDLVHRLLNLAEFMEHEEKTLPIENRTLGEISQKFHAYAKALHYKELEFFTETSPTIIEALIGINSKLQQHDAAWGTLLIAREQYDVSKDEEWYERLGRWQEALVTYDKKAREDPDAPEIVLGRMKCLHALGEWDQLAQQVDEHWANVSLEDRREMAPLAAAAAWSLNDWDTMDDYIAAMRSDSADKPFYRAILCVHQNQFPKALSHIAKARDMLDPDLASLVGESYGWSYNTMVRAQMLSELEEIILYKQHADQPERRQTMRKTWMKRLQACQPDVEVWQRILQVRALVLRPEDDSTTWIKFANLCRKSERMVLAEKTINSLLSPNQLQSQYRDLQQASKAPPHVVYAHLKFAWANGAHEDSLRFLVKFTGSLARDLHPDSGEVNTYAGRQKFKDLSKLLARCWFKQGQWQVELFEDWSQRPIKDILHSYWLATHYDPTWYKAWHTWALANFDVVGYLESQTEGRSELPGEELAVHIVQSMDGFFKSISLRNVNALQAIYYNLKIKSLGFSE
ncbi:FAT domain-containing protein [Irpex lacteus]|nr:FAT domain-containing protein [Irpex lacteus]